MKDLSRAGRILYAIAMAEFGIQYVLHGFMRGPALGPPFSPARPFWGYFTAVVLIIAAVGIATGKQTRCVAILLAITLLLRTLVVYAPRIVAHPHDPGPWTSGFEILAMCCAALVISGLAIGPTRWLFAISLAVFGTQHFLYAKFVATLVPSWIPGHLFWAYFVGVAFVAAALAIAIGKSARLAATLLGLMFFLWVISLHLPRVAAAVHNGDEWTSAFVALAMCGGSWVLAGTVKR
ncbi:MAG: DoxX family membrane protein [Terriglobales bacterium]